MLLSFIYLFVIIFTCSAILGTDLSDNDNSITPTVFNNIIL